MCFNFLSPYIFIYLIDYYDNRRLLADNSFFFITYMIEPSSGAKETIEVTEVRNSKVEDGIFCRRAISVEGHKPLYVARKGAFIITLPDDGENFPRDGREGGGGGTRGKGLIENLIRW